MIDNTPERGIGITKPGLLYPIPPPSASQVGDDPVNNLLRIASSGIMFFTRLTAQLCSYLGRIASVRKEEYNRADLSRCCRLVQSRKEPRVRLAGARLGGSAH